MTYSAWLKEKKKGPCVDCGGRFPPECMEFDHLPGLVKRYNLSEGKGRRDREAEIAKCDLVCVNCHRIRTKRRGYGISPLQRMARDVAEKIKEQAMDQDKLLKELSGED